MKLSFATVLTVSLAFAGSGVLSSLTAQDASVASASDVDQCAKWMRTVKSGSSPDPTEFCSGIYDGRLNAWHSIFECGQPTQQLTVAAPKYCTSSGQISIGEAWAAGFSSAMRDGSDLLGGTSDGAKGAQHAAATFYSRTGVWMGDLRLPAGMYKLIPSKSPDGWNLVVAKQDGEWNDAKSTLQYLGSVQMKGARSDRPARTENLEISTRRWAQGCGGPSADRNVRELHFLNGSTDLFVCIRPDQVSQSQKANIGER